MTDSPDDLDSWTAVDIPSLERQAWARAGFLAAQVRDWCDAGALDPDTAAEWERFGFTPTTAEPWMSIGEIGPADAIAMSEAGMTPAHCARIRARDPRCPALVTDEHGRTSIAWKSPSLGI